MAILCALVWFMVFFNPDRLGGNIRIHRPEGRNCQNCNSGLGRFLGSLGVIGTILMILHQATFFQLELL